MRRTSAMLKNNSYISYIGIKNLKHIDLFYHMMLFCSEIINVWWLLCNFLTFSYYFIWTNSDCIIQILHKRKFISNNLKYLKIQQRAKIWRLLLISFQLCQNSLDKKTMQSCYFGNFVTRIYKALWWRTFCTVLGGKGKQ